MVVGEPPNPHLRQSNLFFLKSKWLWVNLQTLIPGIDNFLNMKHEIILEVQTALHLHPNSEQPQLQL